MVNGTGVFTEPSGAGSGSGGRRDDGPCCGSVLQGHISLHQLGCDWTSRNRRASRTETTNRNCAKTDCKPPPAHP